jgi:hypothetical protein
MIEQDYFRPLTSMLQEFANWLASQALKMNLLKHRELFPIDNGL